MRTRIMQKGRVIVVVVIMLIVGGLISINIINRINEAIRNSATAYKKHLMYEWVLEDLAARQITFDPKTGKLSGKEASSKDLVAQLMWTYSELGSCEDKIEEVKSLIEK